MSGWIYEIEFKLKTIWHVLWESAFHFTKDGCFHLSAAIGYYTLFAIIPFLFIIVSVASFLLGSSEQAYLSTFNLFKEFFPNMSPSVFSEVKNLSSKAQLLGWVGILILLWTASLVFSSIEFALSHVFRVEKRRSFVYNKLLAMIMVPLGGVVIFLSFSITTFSEVIKKSSIQIHNFNLSQLLANSFLVRYILPFFLLTGVLILVYKFVPNIKISFKHAIVGGGLCAILWEIGKFIFTWYIANKAHFSAVYGSLEAIVITVLWVFYSACIFLFCAELISIYRRRDILLLKEAFL